jgi:hypothetical protein
VRANATTVKEYLASVPADRRAAIETVRRTIVENLPAGYEEACSFGMITYQVPLAVYPDTYNKQPLMYAALASQKSHMAVYLCNVYAIPERRAELVSGFAAAGKKLDMGKSCIRFKRLEDLPLQVIGRSVKATPMKAFVEFVRGVQAASPKKKPEAKRPAAKKAPKG